MAKVKIVVPPIEPQLVEVGEIDTDLLARHGRRLTKIPGRLFGGITWYGHIINIPGGCLIFIDSVSEEEVDL